MISLPDPAPRTETLYRDQDEYLANHGVNPYLLPYEDTYINPITLLETLRHKFESLHHTAQTLHTRNFADNFDADPRIVGKNLILLAEVLGSWAAGTGTNDARIFVNPNYIHLDTLPDSYLITDRDERLAVLRRVAFHGTVDKQQVAPRFGLTVDELERFLNRTGFAWGFHRDNGQTVLANTLNVLRDRGVSDESLRFALGLDDVVLSEFVDQYSMPCTVPESATAGLSAD